MRRNYFWAGLLVFFLAFIPFFSARVSGQTGNVPSRISEAVDNTKLTVLRGNVHPMARAEFDRGPAPASLPMEHMLLVLTRSAAQQAALETLLAQQQDRSSPNFHQWLTPEQFGQQFGPSDQDIQAITSWLQSNGFHVNEVAKGRTTIDFSGTAAQVQQAFHTTIHMYVLANGEQHWANSSDPQIPTALAPAVAGINSLNNFPRSRMSHSFGVVRRSNATGKITALSPQFTYGSGCNGSGTNCFAVGPSDFATIYNSQALLNAGINGTGQTIAIVSDSDVNTADITAFRSLFGLPAINFQQIETGTDPGVQAAGDEIEAVLDAEWSGAVAPGAKIDLVVSPSTNTAFGGDTSAIYIINNNLAPVLSYSYGLCELYLGTGGNAFYQQIWSQAATQGITVLVSTGDNGSAACEDPDPNYVSSAQPATTGLAVNGVGSTPYNIAVGGTDFNDSANPTTYWTNTSGTINSAKSYIPEVSYNDSCTNAILSTAGYSSVPETNCNNAALIDFGGVNLIASFGGGGGPSNCTTNGTTSTTLGSVSSCSGGYAKPSWQTGPGIPNDGKRDTPDVSLFSGDGFLQNFYVICEADQDPGNASCNLNSPYQDFVPVGGTSVAAQAFAGVVALIDQKTGSRQGNLNPTLYAIAAEQTSGNCNASGTPASSCIFNDVTSGTIAMPCLKNSPSCTVTNSSDVNGVLTGYSAASGYDLATGLGSINIGNLVNNFGPNFYLSSSNPVVTVSSPGASGTMSVMVYGATTNQGTNPYIGTVTLACSGLPSGATCSFSGGNGFTALNSVTLTAGLTSVPVTVAVNTTTTSRIVPSNHPWGTAGWEATSAVLLSVGLFLAVLRLGFYDGEVRWNTILALSAFALLSMLSACGGGSSSTTTPSSDNTTGPTGNTSAVLTGTASSGSPVSSMNFTVTIQ
jgi:subtilase family serine protease